MRVVVQRVKQAAVAIEGKTVSAIEQGLLVLLGVCETDEEKDARLAAEKMDEQGKMNRSVRDVGGSVLLVSQFTLLGDVRHGRRPSFTAAMEPVRANELYLRCREFIEEAGISCQTGVFQADMQVSLINDGPVTILYDTGRLF